MEDYLGFFKPDRKAGGYTVTFPDFGYGATQGETYAEAMDMAQELLMLTIGDYIRECKQLPTPAHHRGTKFHHVPLPALQSAKVDLYTAFLKSGLKKAEFARRITTGVEALGCFKPRRALPRADTCQARRAPQAPILHGFRQVLGGHGVRLVEIGDGARQLQDAVMRAAESPMRRTAISNVRSPESSRLQCLRSSRAGMCALS